MTMIALSIASIFHADHGVTNETIMWALSEIQPTGFFLRTLELPVGHVDLLNALYGPVAGDAPVSDDDVSFAKRSEDRPASRVVNLPMRPTRLVTLIGIVKDGAATIFTAYGGPAAEREPNDPTLATEEEKATAAAFWATHALAMWEEVPLTAEEQSDIDRDQSAAEHTANTQ